MKHLLIGLNLICLTLMITARNVYSFEFNDLVILKNNPSISETELGEQVDERNEVYDKMHPHFVEMCTASQYIPEEEISFAAKGGTGGHATLFISSACVDGEKNYPALKMCDEQDSVTDEQTRGVGISLNLMFSNIRFVAIPGRDNFYKGPLAWGETITPLKVEEIKKYYYDKPWFKGIKMVEKQMATCRCVGSQCTENEIIKCYIDKNIGIDFASSLARTSYCARLPIPQAGIERMVKYLNQRNEDAQKNGYKYDVILDNCSHIIHNAIAQTGFFDMKKQLNSNRWNQVRGILSEPFADIPLKRIRNWVGGEFGYMSVPTHNLYRLVNRSIDLNLNDLKKVVKNQNLIETLLDPDYSWLPTGSGALVTVLAQRRNNEAFLKGKAGVKLFSLRRGEFQKFTGPDYEDFRDYYSNLYKNLSYHRRKMIEAVLKIERLSSEELQELKSVDKYEILDLLKVKLPENIRKIEQDLNFLESY